MVNIHKLGVTEVEFTNKLGVTRDIKRAFGKDYMKVLDSIQNMSMDEVIKFIHTCKVDKSDGLVAFTDWVYDESGVGLQGLMELLSELVLEIQFPGKTPDERKKLIMEKRREEEEMMSS